MRGRDIDEAREFDDRAEQRVDLGRAAVLDVLQHRGLVRADALGAGDALVDAETEADAERFADGLRFPHHRRRERAGRREAADVLERRMAERADRIEGQIAPELRPDFGAHVGERRRLEARSREELGQRRDALGLLAVDFGDRQAMALDMPDDARALDLRRLVADGGDDGVDRQMASDHAAGIDALEPNAFVRAAMLEEIPPGNAVLRRHDHRRGRDDRGDFGCDRRELMRLDPEHDEVRAAGLGDAVRRLDARDDLFAVLLELEPAFADRLQMLPARHDLHALARRGELGRDVAADRACADDSDVHRAIRTHALPQYS